MTLTYISVLTLEASSRLADRYLVTYMYNINGRSWVAYELVIYAPYQAYLWLCWAFCFDQ